MLPFLFSVSTEREHYKMDNCPRGYCLIINNMCFEDDKLNRPCAVLDEKELQALFENELHFEVHVVNDLQCLEMLEICREYGKKDHSKCDGFVCIVMSHGDTGDKIVGINGGTIGTVLLSTVYLQNLHVYYQVLYN